MKIEVKNYSVSMKIGAMDFERESFQKVSFNIELEFSSSSYELENLESTIDYSSITKLIGNTFDQSEWKLLESVCSEAGKLIMQNFELIDSLIVSVEKSSFPGSDMRDARVLVSDKFGRETL